MNYQPVPQYLLKEIITLNVSASGSITTDSNGTVLLVGDSLNPGNTYYYGTNASGIKGWYPYSGGGGGGSYTASNGITLTGSNFALGGILTQNTTINGQGAVTFTITNDDGLGGGTINILAPVTNIPGLALTGAQVQGAGLTTIAAYNISDAYTKTQADAKYLKLNVNNTLTSNTFVDGNFGFIIGQTTPIFDFYTGSTNSGQIRTTGGGVTSILSVNTSQSQMYSGTSTNQTNLTVSSVGYNLSVPTGTTPTWVTTGFASYQWNFGSDVTGDMYYRSSGGLLTKLSAGAIGTAIVSNGPATAPSYQPVSNPDDALLYALAF